MAGRDRLDNIRSPRPPAIPAGTPEYLSAFERTLTRRSTRTREVVAYRSVRFGFSGR